MKIIRSCTVPNSLSFVEDMIPDFQKSFEVGILSSSGSSWNSLDIYGDSISRHIIEMERHIAPWKDLKALVKIVRLFRKEKPDLVHSMTPKAGLLCMIAGKLTGVPIRIHTFTGLVFPTSLGLKRKILMVTDWLTCACASHIIPEGEGVKRDLLNNGITRKPISVLGKGSCVGIDLDKFKRTPDIENQAQRIRNHIKQNSHFIQCCDISCQNTKISEPQREKIPLFDNLVLKNLTRDQRRPRDSSSIYRSQNSTPPPPVVKDGEGVFIFIAVGRLVGDKGINELVAAFSKLNKEIPNTRLVLVGREEPDLDPLSQETIIEIESNLSIVAIGQQEDVRPWLAAADCAVLASYREGFPNVVLEAGALGLPQIVTDINGANEIVIDGVNGLIIPSKDQNALYNSMKQMYLKEDIRHKMKECARKMIESKYDKNYVKRSLLNFYDEIIKERKKKL